MAGLKGMVDMLEKLVRDTANLIEGQLARAQATIIPEQLAELDTAFKHFDKNKNGSLNKLEFGAAMKSLDFSEDAMGASFDKYAEGEGEGASVAFEAFVTIVLQQYKDKDTMDGLLAALRTLANDKDTLLPSALKENLKPAQAEFLQGKMKLVSEGYEYAEFAESVYGDGADLDRSLTMAFAKKKM